MSATLHRSLIELASRWPADPLRTIQFSEAIKAATTRIFIPVATASPDTAPLPNRELSGKSLENGERTLASLDRLLNDSAKKTYPITNKTLIPASYPNHYKKLQEGIDRANRGESLNRGWFSFIRWSRT